jgi:hypothetical protein
MRITKKMLKQAIGRLRIRLGEIASISELGGTRAELEREIPAYKDVPPDKTSEARMVRALVWEAIDKAIPSDWYQ